MVVHHYNRSREAKGSGRLSGAGPAEWGRVLIGTNVVSRYTDTITKETKVITELGPGGRPGDDLDVAIPATGVSLGIHQEDLPLWLETLR